MTTRPTTAILQLAEDLKSEFAAITGNSLRLFVDRTSLEWGTTGSEDRRGDRPGDVPDRGAARTASSTAMNVAATFAGQSSRNACAGTVPVASE
jgi:hypothetical protein